MWRAGFTLLAAAALAAAGCGGGGSDRQTVAQETAVQLGRPGSAWSALKGPARIEALKDCRLAAAVAAATPADAATAPYFSDRYRAIQRLDEVRLGVGLDRFFAGTRRDDETLQAGCTRVATRLADVAAVARRPHAELSLPVAARTKGPFSLTVSTADTRITGRVTPSDASIRLVRPADRSRTPATWTTRRRGDGVTFDLRGLPLGVTYLRVEVSGPTGSSSRLLVITRKHASRLQPPRTFVPIVLNGTGSRTLSVLDVPRRAIATVRSNAPLALSSSHTLLLTHRKGRMTQTIAPGLYRDVRIAAAGTWSLRLAPLRSAPS
jgi:hypothetical protein